MDLPSIRTNGGSFCEAETRGPPFRDDLGALAGRMRRGLRGEGGGKALVGRDVDLRVLDLFDALLPVDKKRKNHN